MNSRIQEAGSNLQAVRGRADSANSHHNQSNYVSGYPLETAQHQQLKTSSQAPSIAQIDDNLGINQADFEERSMGAAGNSMAAESDKLSQQNQIRETAQKQFSLGYQEPEPSDLQSERIGEGFGEGEGDDEGDGELVQNIADRELQVPTQDLIQQDLVHHNNSRGADSISAHNQQNTSYNSSQDIKITIELGEGLQEDIIVPQGRENCAGLYSQDFCRKHGYDKAIEQALTEKIREHIDKIQSDRKNQLGRGTQGGTGGSQAQRESEDAGSPTQYKGLSFQEKDIDLEVIPENEINAECSNSNFKNQEAVASSQQNNQEQIDHEMANLPQLPQQPQPQQMMFQQPVHFDSRRASSNDPQSAQSCDQRQQMMLDQAIQKAQAELRSQQQVNPSVDQFQMPPANIHTSTQITTPNDRELSQGNPKRFKQLARTGMVDSSGLKSNPYSPQQKISKNNAKYNKSFKNTDNSKRQSSNEMKSSQRSKNAASSNISKHSSASPLEKLNQQIEQYNSLNNSIINVDIKTSHEYQLNQSKKGGKGHPSRKNNLTLTQKVQGQGMKKYGEDECSPQFQHARRTQWLQSSNKQATGSDQQINISTVQGLPEESNIDSKYLKDQNVTILSTHSPAATATGHDQVMSSNNYTRNVKMQQFFKSQEQNKGLSQHPKSPIVNHDDIIGSGGAVNGRKSSMIYNLEGMSFMVDQNNVQNPDFITTDGGHVDSTQIYKQLLAQSEYGYVAKMGKWKQPQVNKHDFESIQKKSFTFGSKSLSTADHHNVSNEKQQRRKKAKSQDSGVKWAGPESTSDAILGGNRNVRSKPFVNQISQLLARTSTKRMMPSDQDVHSRPHNSVGRQSKSIHDRLYLQHTKGKVLYKLMQQQEEASSAARNSQGRGKKGGQRHSKSKSQFKKFLVTNVGHSREPTQANEELQDINVMSQEQMRLQQFGQLQVQQQPGVVSQPSDGQMPMTNELLNSKPDAAPLDPEGSDMGVPLVSANNINNAPEQLQYPQTQSSLQLPASNHQKSQSMFQFRTLNPPTDGREAVNDNQNIKLSQNDYQNNYYNNYPVSIEVNSAAMSDHLDNKNQLEQAKLQHKFQTISAGRSQQNMGEDIQYHTPMYRPQPHLSTNFGKSEIVRLQVSGTEHQPERNKTTRVPYNGLTVRNDESCTNRNQTYSHAQPYGDEDTMPPESENFSVAAQENAESAPNPNIAHYDNMAHDLQFQEQQSAPHLNSSQSQNFGERLYKKGIIRNMQRQHFLNEMVKLKEAQELSQATFHPMIANKRVNKSQEPNNDNNRSDFPHNATFDTFHHQNQQQLKPKMIIKDGLPAATTHVPKSKMDKAGQQNLGNRLIEYGLQLQLRKAAAKQIQDEQEVRSFEFKPKINKKSIRMVNDRKQGNLSMQGVKSPVRSLAANQKSFGNAHLKKVRANLGSQTRKISHQKSNTCFGGGNEFTQTEQGLSEQQRAQNQLPKFNYGSPQPSSMFFSPKMSHIESENQILHVKTPANIKQFNFQDTPCNEYDIVDIQQSQSHQKQEPLEENQQQLLMNNCFNQEVSMRNIKEQSVSQKSLRILNKHDSLYNDAKSRYARQRDVYSHYQDTQCTFKPERITQQSNLSRKIVREVQNEVKEKIIQQKLQGTADLAMASTMSLNLTQRNNEASTSRLHLQKFNQNMKQMSKNDSIMGAPLREVLPYDDNNCNSQSLLLNSNQQANQYNNEPMTIQDLYRQKSNEKQYQYNNMSLIDERSHSQVHNQLSPQLSNSRLLYLNQSTSHKQRHQPVFKRLADQAQLQMNHQKELQQQRQRQETSHDPVTGQRFFKPLIKRHQSQDRRTQPHQVSQQLYVSHSLTQEKIRHMRDQELRQLKEQRKIFSRANSKSDRIILGARKQKLAEIFDRIDHDGDGEISSNKIDITQLEEKLVRIFRPLFNELQILMQPLDKEEFVDAGMRLYDSLSQNEKNTILKFDKKQSLVDHELQKCTFTPNINTSTVESKVYSYVRKKQRDSSGQRDLQAVSSSFSGGTGSRQMRQQKKLKKFLTAGSNSHQNANISFSGLQNCGFSSQPDHVGGANYQMKHQEDSSYFTGHHNSMPESQIINPNAVANPTDLHLSMKASSSYASGNRYSSKDQYSKRITNEYIESKMQTSRLSESQQNQGSMNQIPGNNHHQASNAQFKKKNNDKNCMILNDKIADKQLIHSVHQKLCDLQNQSKTNTVVNSVPNSNILSQKAQSAAYSQHNQSKQSSATSIQSQNNYMKNQLNNNSGQSERDFNDGQGNNNQFLQIPVEHNQSDKQQNLSSQDKPGSSLSIIDIGSTGQQQKHQQISKHESSIMSQISSQSVPRPLNALRVPSMEVQPPAIIGQLGDSEKIKSNGSFRAVIPGQQEEHGSHSRQQQLTQFTGITQTPNKQNNGAFNYNAYCSSQDARTSISQLSSGTNMPNAENGHHKESLGVEQISPVRDADQDRDQLIKLELIQSSQQPPDSESNSFNKQSYAPCSQSIQNPYVHQNVRRNSKNRWMRQQQQQQM